MYSSHGGIHCGHWPMPIYNVLEKYYNNICVGDF